MYESELVILKGFDDTDIKKVFVSSCCERLYVGVDPATKCSTCPTIPENLELEWESFAEVEPKLKSWFDSQDV